jgi:hypothetical protein
VSKLPTGRNAHQHITEFDQVGEPVRLHKVLAKYETVIGALVRDYIPIKYRRWNGKDDDRWRVPGSEKDDIWENKILVYFTFPIDYDKEQEEKSKRNHGDMLQDFQEDIVQDPYPQG